jgi:phosphoenolpyruvate synthase/pyruvate phosphate dikinase
VGSSAEWVIPLAGASEQDEPFIGGKASKLAQLTQAGFRVPDGFSVTTHAYESFIKGQNLARLIRMELGRKPFESMRWEEVWDTALRIRSAFLSSPVPPDIAGAIAAAVRKLGTEKPLAVRSSAPGEDSALRSFAGLHESVVGVMGDEAVLDAVRVVWASLWSDAALLYRQELALDPAHSRMAVVIQEMVDEDRSGVAFGRDPRQPSLDQAIVECVPGPCGDLVDGIVDPDRWVVHRTSGNVLSWRPGEREGEGNGGPILGDGDLNRLLNMLLKVESTFGWPADTEWTGRQERFTLLQARPITTAGEEGTDSRSWYLTLRPGMRRLSELAVRVAGQLIPELEALGERFAAEAVENYGNGELASAIAERHLALEHWRQVYLDDFIPFAHGVRQLGTYYNDAVRPQDPYEFVELLKGERMVASQRNQALSSLAEGVRGNPALGEALRRASAAVSRQGEASWQQVLQAELGPDEAQQTVAEIEALLEDYLDVAYGSERLSDHPDLVFNTILEMASVEDKGRKETPSRQPETSAEALELRLLQAVGPDRQDEAREMLAIGRLSWRLRDDDNLLVGRLESQLLRTLNLAASRLRAEGRLQRGAQVTILAASVLGEALRGQLPGTIELPEPEPERKGAEAGPGETPRQLVGQPASPGLASGRVRVIRSTEDLGQFRAGDVLVCDAIQPTMTHLVPLASAIIERRGGMLIHGAIIARELGIPCVNGIANAVGLLENGQIVTVDGYLGIVTVGAPEFDLEAA